MFTSPVKLKILPAFFKPTDLEDPSICDNAHEILQDNEAQQSEGQNQLETDQNVVVEEVAQHIQKDLEATESSAVEIEEENSKHRIKNFLLLLREQLFSGHFVSFFFLRWRWNRTKT